MKLPAILLLVIDIFIHPAVAQLPPTFQIRHYTTENGLPSNGIKGMEWDEQTGFLWVATEAGVVRFNGIDFKTFTNKNTPTISSERFRLLTANNKGTIYAADEYENIFKVHQNELVLHRKTPIEARADIYRAYFALSASDTLFNYKISHSPAKPLLIDFSTAMPLTDTSVLFISAGQPLVITLSSNVAAPLITKDLFITEVFKIEDQVFLMSKDRRIFGLDIAAHHLFPVKFDELFEDEFNKGEFHFFWNRIEKNSIVVKNNKAWELSYSGTTISAEEICDILAVNTRIVFVQYSRRKKILFIGTDAKGFFVITQNRVDAVKKNLSISGGTNAYYSQIELPDERVLTDIGDVLGKGKNIHYSSPVKYTFYNAYLTSDSLLWYNNRIDSDSSLYCYNYKTGTTRQYNKVEAGAHFGLCLSNGKIYIANNKGLAVLQGDSLHYFFYTPERSWPSPFTMVELSTGVFAVSYCKLYRYNTITGVSDIILDLPDNCVRALWKYKDYLFIGTYGKGYYIYKNGRLKAMPLDKNKFLLYTHCFIADQYGYCWMSTNRGLFKSRLTDLVNAFEHNDEKIYYHYFGRNDGMNMTEMNGSYMPAALQMQNKTISFPTMDGLVWVDPNKAVPILPTGDIYIDEIQADNEKKDPDSIVKKGLPPDTKEIAIQLGYSAWCNKENLYIDYDLNNSGKWKNVNVDNEAVIRLYNLPHGDYKLRIRKMNGFGPGNYSYNEFHFSIHTPWYRQWWFYILAALVVMGIGRLYIKLRTRQYILQQRKLERQVFEKTKELQLKNEILEKNDTIKTRLISIISHDIITPLKFLTVTGRNLVQKKQMISEEMRDEAIEEITNTSQNLERLSTNILNWIKYQNENGRMVKDNIIVHEKVDRVLAILKPLAHQKQQQLLNNVDDRLILYQYADPLRILIYNLVMNAINFSERGDIIISAQQEPGYVTINVKDEGIGMTREQVNNIMGDQVVVTVARTDNRKGHGLGYLIIKDLIKMIGAELIINSEKGKGTMVSIKIPTV